eukprot:151529-Rhodomonas_salina.6
MRKDRIAGQSRTRIAPYARSVPEADSTIRTPQYKLSSGGVRERRRIQYLIGIARSFMSCSMLVRTWAIRYLSTAHRVPKTISVLHTAFQRLLQYRKPKAISRYRTLTCKLSQYRTPPSENLGRPYAISVPHTP